MKLPIKNIILLVLMLVSAGLGTQLRLTIAIADELPPIDLKAMVPTAFGNWQEQVNFSNQIVDPNQKQMLEEIYSQTLSRTYINPNGYRIMLSIAYGKNQRRKLQLHRPEVCYPAQGFALFSNKPGKIELNGQSIAVTLLETSLGQRFEPLTYWAVVGDKVTANQNEKRLAEVGYAMRGRIPDGMIVRISSIDKDTASAYAIQRQFAIALIQAIAPEHRGRFAGKAQAD
jgi:EpsI family protein